MGEILGLGLSHYPGPLVPGRYWARMLARNVKIGRVAPAAFEDKARWPAEMRAEWGDDEGAAAGFEAAYSLAFTHPHGLAHSFNNTVLFLDRERSGFPYPVIPVHVNCYGNQLLSTASAAMSEGGEVVTLPPPTPRRCFELGAATARFFAASRWRVALIGSASFSSYLFNSSKCFAVFRPPTKGPS